MRKFRVSLHGEPEDVIVEAENIAFYEPTTKIAFYNGQALNDKSGGFLPQDRTVFMGFDVVYFKDITEEPT